MTQHKLLICGEAWGAEEEEQGRPFVGASGRLLKSMLSQCGIRWQEAYLTNVFNFRPQPTNDVSNLCGSKVEGIPHLKPLVKGKYVKACYAGEIERLVDEVKRIRPNLILALGNTALWALCPGQLSISKARGTIMQSHLDGIKVLPTYHPAAILRSWGLRPVVFADLAKAAREMESPDFNRPSREIWIEPSLSDIETFFESYVKNSKELSEDIETQADQITCVGFAPSPKRALVIPFYDRQKEDGNYWPDLDTELRAWAWVKRMSEMAVEVRVGQNYLYDAHFLWRRYGIASPNTHDTMLLHHALQPELEKGLGFLGSIYTEEPAWKFMGRDTKTLKKEDE